MSVLATQTLVAPPMNMQYFTPSVFSTRSRSVPTKPL